DSARSQFTRPLGEPGPGGYEGGAGGLDEVTFSRAGDPDDVDPTHGGELGGHEADTATGAEHEHALPGCRRDLVDEVEGSGPGHRQRRRVDEGDLLRLGDGLGRPDEGVLGPAPAPARHPGDDRVPDGEAAHAVAGADDDPGDLEAHPRRQLAAGPEQPLADLPVGRVHPAGPDLDEQLTGTRLRHGTVLQLLGLRTAEPGEDVNLGHRWTFLCSAVLTAGQAPGTRLEYDAAARLPGR